MRARQPDQQGSVDRDGVRIVYDVYENDGPTVMLVPTWCLFHARSWKMQIPYLARHYRVVTYDPRGNGRSDRPQNSDQQSWQDNVGDLLAVLDATSTEKAVLVGLSLSGYWANLTSALHPERVHGVVAIAPASGLGIVHPERAVYSFTDELDTTEGWAKENVHYIRRHYRDYIKFFVSRIFTEAHSTKPLEDGVGWAMETDAETLIASDMADKVPDGIADVYRRTARPLLIIHGDEDRLLPIDSSRELARLTGGVLVTMQGSGHAPNLRDPVPVNRMIREFVDRVASSRGVAA